jgi:hypothetical protein
MRSPWKIHSLRRTENPRLLWNLKFISVLNIYQHTWWITVLPETDSCLPGQINFPSFTKPEHSLLSSQDPATGPYPKPAKSSLHHHTLVPQDPFSYYPPSALMSPKWALPFRIFNQNFEWISNIPHACHMSCPSQPLWFDHSKKIQNLISLFRNLGHAKESVQVRDTL